MRKKLCFLYLDEPHNIFHSISIAQELSLHNEYQIDILCTERNRKFIEQNFDSTFLRNIKVKTLRPHWHFSIPHYLEIKLQFRKSIFLKYRNALKEYDAFICCLYNDHILKNRLGNKWNGQLIFAGHGIANNTNYSYNSEIKNFDLILVAGNKEQAARLEMGHINEQNHQLIGYVKYDLCKTLRHIRPFSATDKVVLYNPHWRNDLTSFHKYGEQILDFFLRTKTYKLVFAPHSLLLVRNRNLKNSFKKYANSENIIIDYSSSNLSDMTYTKSADLFLGDVSSQALEFLLHKKRPCLFLKNDSPSLTIESIHSWQAGKVIEGKLDLEKELEHAFSSHEAEYMEIQNDLVNEIFSINNSSPTTRAAEAIRNFISRKEV